MASLVATPNPTKAERVDVAGTGFDPAIFIALVFDGSGTTIKIPVRRDGSFAVGTYIASTKPDGSYRLEARKYGTKTVLAFVMVQVQRAVVVPPPVDPDPVVTAGPTASDITQTTAKVTWTVSRVATGWVEYGLTSTYGKSTPAELSFNHSTHVQPIGGLVAGQTYQIRVTGKDQAGRVYSKTGSFTTSGVVVTPPVEPPPGPEPTPTPPPTGNLQQIIDGTQSGGSADVAGMVFAGRAIFRKPIWLKGIGAKINVPANGPGCSLWSDGIRIEGLGTVGAQGTVYNGLEVGFTTRDAPKQIAGLELIGTSAKLFGYGGYYLGHTGVGPDGIIAPFLDEPLSEDSVYAGIMLLSATGAWLVNKGIARRIIGSAVNQWNAYGMSASKQSPAEAVSSGGKFVDCIVEDVPTWSAFDTHGGRDMGFIRPIVRRSRRGVFVTGADGGFRATNVLTDGAIIEAPVAFNGNIEWPVTYIFSTGGKITGSKSSGWAPNNRVLTTSGSDANATAVGLVIDPSNVWG